MRNGVEERVSLVAPLEKVTRDWWALGLPNPHHRRDPRAWLWRLRHWATGPRRGCSCTRCFRHPRRRVPAAEFYKDRTRAAVLDEKLTRCMAAVAALATELDIDTDEPRMSAEEVVERILYPGHFGTDHAGLNVGARIERARAGR